MTKRITQSQLESYLWGAAVLLRGYIDAGDYKQFIFPLLFYKRLCDVYDEEVAQALGERLEKIRERHEQGLIDSKEFLKQLLELAKDVLEAEQEVDPVEEQDKAKSTLTELFMEVRNEDTPVIVERIVNDIDEIIRMVRFPGWQGTSAGEREVQKALLKTLLKYHLHKDQDLFDRAYGYIRQYY